MSLLGFLRSGPPPPSVALLPDAMFFTRSVPVTAGATPADASTQIELALEAISPFPLAQLYYGWFWVPGAERAFVFAAYRRRFTSEQAAQWQGAELVIPAFASVFGIQAEPATTVVLSSESGFTAVHWDSGPVPAKVLFRPVDLEATAEDRAATRDALVRSMGGSKTVIDLESAPVPDPAHSDREVVFRAGEIVSRLPVPVVASLDVRDKAELVALRASRRRDILLWRLTLASAAALVILGLGELALVGGRGWQQVRTAKVRGQQPLVDNIEQRDAQAKRIEDLSTKRLLPLEMLAAIVGENLERKPGDITFTWLEATQTRGLYTVMVRGQTNNTAQITVYERTLAKLPETDKVDSHVESTRGDVTNFTLTVTFKPNALKPIVPPA